MKKPIILAAVAMSVLIAFSIYGIALARDYSSGSFIKLGIQGLLLYGLFVGHRLVWQWGRILTLLAFIGISAATILSVSKGAMPVQALPVFLFVGLPALIIFITFGTNSAKEHFNLACPNCSNKKVKADDFLFNKAKCKQCNFVW
jgi:hypothetical protein